jgi:HEAT repeat protein
MPLVKGGAAPPPPGCKDDDDRFAFHVSALAHPEVDTRWKAARALGGRAEAVAALANALAAEQVPQVREAIMTALMRVGNNTSVTALLPYLRSQDAGMRSAAIEALQALPETTRPFLMLLLQDEDSDVRILACELGRNLPAEQATQFLCALLEHEDNANVCAAAIDVLADVGSPAAVAVLHACAKRFAETPFLPFAVSVAIARISGTKG